MHVLTYTIIFVTILQKSEPTLYNNFMKKFKDFLIEKGKRDFLEMIVDGRVFSSAWPKSSLMYFMYTIYLHLFLYWMLTLTLSTDTIYPFLFVFFWCRKFGKSVTYLICHFFQFGRFITENDTGYEFCVFNSLRLTVKEVTKKEKIRSLQDIQYLLIEECLAASCIFSISMINN